MDSWCCAWELEGTYGRLAGRGSRAGCTAPGRSAGLDGSVSALVWWEMQSEGRQTLTQLGRARRGGRAAHAACGRERRRRRQTTARHSWERPRGRREERWREEGVRRAARRPRGRRRPRCLRRSRCCCCGGGRAGVLGPRTRQLGRLPVLGGDGRHGRRRPRRLRGHHALPRAGGRGPAAAPRHGEIGPPLGGRQVSFPWLFCRSVGGLLTADIPQRLLDLADCAVRRGRRASSCGCSRQQEGHSGGIRG